MITAYHKIIILILFIFIAQPSFAKTEDIDGKQVECDERYSHKDFTNQTLEFEPDMSGILICGSCFSQEILQRDIFPRGMRDTTFIWCNLDNVFIPDGNRVINSSQDEFQVQADLEDWKIDERGDPVEPVNKEQFLRFGLSADPIDIVPSPDGKSPIQRKIEEGAVPIDVIGVEEVVTP